MKKMNKKGFTLAELLIVLAILAILIAIAIPVFTAQLENARRQADHANLRSAYAIAQTANILGLDKVDGGAVKGATYKTDGTFKSTGTAVTIQANPNTHKSGEASCDACVVDCTKFQTKGGNIFIVYDSVDEAYVISNTNADITTH